MNFNSIAASSINLFDPNSIWWFLQQGVLNILDGLNNCFYILAGITNPYQGGEAGAGLGAGDVESSLLYRMFKEPSITRTFTYFCFAALFICAICMIISLLKNMSINEERAGKSMAGTIGRTFKGIVYMVAIPLIFMLSIYTVSIMLNFIVGVMGAQIGEGNTSIAQSIFNVCWPVEDIKEIPQNWRQVSYETLKTFKVDSSYDYTLGIFAGCLVLFAIVKVCILLVERFIDIIWLYLCAPFVVARLPLDKEKSFEQWKEQCLVKFLSVAGIVISMYLYFFILPFINSSFDQVVEDPNLQLGRSFTKLLFIIGGAFAVSKGSVKLATMISAGAAQSEGMSAAETSNMLSGGTRMAMAGIGKAMAGAGVGLLGGLSGAGRARALMGGAGGGATGGGATGGVTNASGALSAVAGTTGGAGANNSNKKMQKQQAKQAKKQAQLMSGTTVSGALAKGGVLGVLGYGATKAVGGIGRAIGAGAKKVVSAIPHKKEDKPIPQRVYRIQAGGNNAINQHDNNTANAAGCNAKNAGTKKSKIDQLIKNANTVTQKPKQNKVDAYFSKQLDKMDKIQNTIQSKLGKKGVGDDDVKKAQDSAIESRKTYLQGMLNSTKGGDQLSSRLGEKSKDRLRNFGIAGHGLGATTDNSAEGTEGGTQ